MASNDCRGTGLINPKHAAAQPAAMAERLAELKADGLTITDCITAFAASTDDPYVAVARKLVLGDDGIEIDPITTTSVAHDGAWVLNWLWVSNDEAGVLSNAEVLEKVWEYASKRMSDEQGLKVGHDIAADWLEDLISNFSDELDGIETEELKGVPGPITWIGADDIKVSFMPSDALNQLRLLARKNGLPDKDADQAEKFCIRYGNKLDAILTAVQTV